VEGFRDTFGFCISVIFYPYAGSVYKRYKCCDLGVLSIQVSQDKIAVLREQGNG
jgi:hypothetical protein